MHNNIKTAIITGVTGQDGSYLSEFLLGRGYSVVGVSRRTSTNNLSRLNEALNHPRFRLIEGDVTDFSSVLSWFEYLKPDELYNLAAQSHVGTSFNQPIYTMDVDYKGVLNILECIKKISPQTRLYQASTSEMFGNNKELGEQDENTPFSPQSPYAIAKVAAHQLVRLYRESYGLYAVSGILFNHESPRRGENFVTRKITKWIGEFINWKRYHSKYTTVDVNRDDIHNSYIHSLDQNSKQSSFPKLKLGNMNSYRDWGHAKDYVRAMCMMLQQDPSDLEDFVVSTGETHQVKEFLTTAFEYIKIFDYENYINIDQSLIRPAEVNYLKGDSFKIRNKLGWMPIISFKELVHEMVEYDIKEAKAKN